MKIIVRNKNGFTLVEMAIVLVIVGLLVGLGSSMIGPLTNMAKLRETREIIDSDITSVIGWAASNNRLPDVAAFQASTKRTTDSWTRPLIYLYDNSLNTPATKDTICGRRSTQISLQTIDPAATINNVAFVIISQGEDPSTTTPALFTTLDSAAVTTITASALTTPPNPRAIVVPAATDDIVRWVTLDELRSKIGCQGAQLKILNNELPFTSSGSTYGPINVIADGGTRSGNYEWRIKVPPTAQKPSNLTFTPNLPFANTSTSNWASGASTAPLIIGGNPSPTGSFNYTIYVRDNGGNTAQKSFVLTINP